jgi:cytoskeletal protein CcmA (bactofilin family)
MIRGKIRCARLRIERRAKVQFIQPVEAGETVINGRVIGSIRSTSTVTLLRRSHLRGNITATELITKRGAKHIGRLRIAESLAEQEAQSSATLDAPQPAD